MKLSMCKVTVIAKLLVLIVKLQAMIVISDNECTNISDD